METKEKSYLFVYGTLKRGESAHYFLAEEKFIGPAELEGYEMYDLGEYPGIVKGKGKVYGELYAVSYETLKKLDEFEENGLFYLRKKEKIKVKDKVYEAWVYEYIETLKNAKKIESGIWKGKK